LEYIDALPMHEALNIIEAINNRELATEKNREDSRPRR